MNYDTWKLATPPYYEEEEKAFEFEVVGGFTASGYSEEDAKEDLIFSIEQAIKKGEIEINLVSVSSE